MLNSLKSVFGKLFSGPTEPNPQNSTDGPAPYPLHLNTNRNGKIAHLPRDLRDRVCQLIYEGNSLTKLAEGLNQMPEVKSMLSAHFEGVPISQQNLSEWKAGGYRDWLLQRQLLEQKGELVADAEQLAEKAKNLSDHIFGMLTLDYAQIMKNRDQDEEAFEKKRKSLSILSQDIVRLRRCHIQARRVEIQEGCFERGEDKTREQVVHQFAEWASHPDIRRIFILEPANHMRLLRQKFNLPPTKEDQLLESELEDNDPDSTPPADPQTDHKPLPTEKCEPPMPTGSLSQRERDGVRESHSEDNAAPTQSSPIGPMSPAGTAETPPKKTSEIIAEIEEDYARKQAEKDARRMRKNHSTSSAVPVSEEDKPLPPKPPLNDYEKALLEGKTPYEALWIQFTRAPKKPAPPEPPPQPLYTPPGHNPLKYYGPCPAPGSYDWPKLQYG